MSMSYCLRGKDSSISRPIAEVRQQIWETTRDIIEMSHHHWRVLLVKNEPIDIEEAEGPDFFILPFAPHFPLLLITFFLLFVNFRYDIKISAH